MIVEVLLGDFCFIEPKLVRPTTAIKCGIDFIQDNNISYEGLYHCFINKIQDIARVEECDLDDFCEKSLDMYESYLIPSLYNGEIIIE